jgi:hypothetical protein
MTDIKRNGPAASPWRDEKIVARTKELWADHTATQIAAMLVQEFKVDVTRNSIIGFLHREKLTAEHKKVVHPKTRGQIRRRKPVMPTEANTRPVRSNPFQRPPAFRAEPFPSDFVDIVVDPLNITFADLADGQCKSIVNNDTSAPLYCGHFTEKGYHYCRQHRSLYYVPGKRNGAIRPVELGKSRGGVFGRSA